MYDLLDLDSWFEFLFVHIIVKFTKAHRQRGSVVFLLAIKHQRAHDMVSHFAMTISVSRGVQGAGKTVHIPTGCSKALGAASPGDLQVAVGAQHLMRSLETANPL